MNYKMFIRELKTLMLPVFSLDDAERILNNKRNYVSVFLSRGIKKRDIFLIKKGIYAIPSSTYAEIATNIIKPSYITMAAALYYRSLVDQQPNIIQVFNTSISRELKFKISDGTYKLKITKIRPKRLFGFERIKGKNGFLYIAFAEKAIVDALYLPKYCPEFYITDVLSNDKIDMKKLEDYAKRMESKALLKRLQKIIKISKSEIEE